MAEGYVIRDDKGGVWFAWRDTECLKRVMHAPQGKRFWHEGETGFAEAEIEGVTEMMRAEGYAAEATVPLGELWNPPPEPREDPKLERIIRRILGETPWERSGAGVLSTSETITVALATGMHEELPPRFQDPSDAWARLDAIQQAIVGRHVPDDDANYVRDPAPKY